MKNIIITTLLLSTTALLQAQTPAGGFQQLYYERNQSAAKTFAQVVAQHPDDATAWLGLTKASMALEEYQPGLDQLRQAPAAIKADPFFEAAYGAALLHNGKKDSAQLYFSRAL